MTWLHTAMMNTSETDDCIWMHDIKATLRYLHKHITLMNPSTRCTYFVNKQFSALEVLHIMRYMNLLTYLLTLHTLVMIQRKMLYLPIYVRTIERTCNVIVQCLCLGL